MKRFGWPQIFLLLVLIALIAGGIVCAVFAVTFNPLLVFVLIILLIAAIAAAVELIDSLKKKGESQ